tara:strand:+ start:1647 stop:2114 length:468 start_codon:yes stop_codon:yes gene_type:complete
MATNQTQTVYGITPTHPTLAQAKSKKDRFVGLNFPLGSKRDIGGHFSRTTDVTTVRSAVKQLMQTERGERVMLPDFGTNLRRFLFQPLDEITFEQIKEEVATSFNKYIIGATLEKLSVFSLDDVGPSGGNSLKVILLFSLDKEDSIISEVEVKVV